MQVVRYIVTIRQLPADAGRPIDPREVKADLEAILAEEGYVNFDVEPVAGERP